MGRAASEWMAAVSSGGRLGRRSYGGVSLVAKRHQSMGSRGISSTASGGLRR